MSIDEILVDLIRAQCGDMDNSRLIEQLSLAQAKQAIWEVVHKKLIETGAKLSVIVALNELFK